MAIILLCPECGTKYKVSDEAVGKNFPCRECDEQISVTEAQADSEVDEYGKPFDEADDYDDEEPIPSKRQRRSSADSGTPKKRKKRPGKKENRKAEPENFIERFGVWNLVSISAGVIFFIVALLGAVVPAIGIWVARIGIGLSFVMLTAAVIWIYTTAFLADTRDFKIFTKCMLFPPYVIVFIKDEINTTWKAVVLALAAGILLFFSIAYKNFSEKRAGLIGTASAHRIVRVELPRR